METEQQAYEVPGQHLRWRVAQLQAQGLPFNVQPAGGGVYIVIVQQPAGGNPFAYQPAHRARPGVSGGVLRWLLFAAVAALFVAALWLVFVRAGGEDAQQQPPQQGTQQGTQEGGWWDWLPALPLPDLPLPWAADEPSQPATQPATQDGGWRWPWESAADGLADAAQSVQDTVTIAAGAVLAVLVLLIVLALVRRRR